MFKKRKRKRTNLRKKIEHNEEDNNNYNKNSDDNEDNVDLLKIYTGKNNNNSMIMNKKGINASTVGSKKLKHGLGLDMKSNWNNNDNNNNNNSEDDDNNHVTNNNSNKFEPELNTTKEAKKPKILSKFGPMSAPKNVRVTTIIDYQQAVCKDFKETGFCGFGDTCIYLHDRESFSKKVVPRDREWEVLGGKTKKKTTILFGGNASSLRATSNPHMAAAAAVKEKNDGNDGGGGGDDDAEKDKMNTTKIKSKSRYKSVYRED